MTGGPSNCLPRGLLITGTDTGAGKTFVTAGLAVCLRQRGVRVGIYKPACSGATPHNGCLVWEDVETHYDALGGQFDRQSISPQCFIAPLAPPAAARQEGKKVDAQAIRDGLQWWSQQVDIVFVEGVGGFLCPLTENATVADFATEWGLPVLIVARRGLGTINHTLLTIEAIRSRGLTVAGVILNQSEHDALDESRSTNGAEIARRGQTTLFAEFAHQSSPHPATTQLNPNSHWLTFPRSASQDPIVDAIYAACAPLACVDRDT